MVKLIHNSGFSSLLYCFISSCCWYQIFALQENIPDSQTCPADSKHFKIICYVPIWKVTTAADAFNADLLDPFQCSFIVVAYLSLMRGPSEWTIHGLTLDHEREFYRKLVKLKEINPSLRILLAVGGYTDNIDGQKYNDLISNEVNTKNFGSNVVKFLKELDADGLAFHLNFPAPENKRPTSPVMDRENLGKFAETFCPFLQKEQLICKINLPRVSEGVLNGQLPDLVPLRQIVKYADLVGLWTEDIPPASTTFTQIWHTDNLYGPAPELGISNEAEINKYSMDHFVRIFTDHVLNSKDNDLASSFKKLILTIPFQSNAFDLSKYNNWNKPWETFIAGGNIDSLPDPPVFGDNTNSGYSGHLISNSFAKVCNNMMNPAVEPKHKLHIKSHYTNPNGIKSSPVAYNKDILIPMNNAESVQDKVNYARVMKLGGVSLYELGSDDIQGWCYNQSFPLLNAATNLLGECRQF